MPNLYTHVCFGKEVACSLPVEVADAVNAEKGAYDLGCTGPDFLFILRETGIGNVPEYAEKMHAEHVYDVFRALAECLKGNRNPVKLAYSLGLMSHYVLDFTLHPYVFETVKSYAAGALPPEGAPYAHHLIESAVDEFYISGRGMRNGHKLSATRAAKEEIASLYMSVIDPIFGEKLSARSVRIAYSLVGRALKLSRDVSGMNRRIIRALEKIFMKGKMKFSSFVHPPCGYGEIDYLNYSHRSFPVVRGGQEEEPADVPELLKRALRRAADYMTEFFMTVKGEAELHEERFGINYEGCIVR